MSEIDERYAARLAVLEAEMTQLRTVQDKLKECSKGFANYKFPGNQKWFGDPTPAEYFEQLQQQFAVDKTM